MEMGLIYEFDAVKPWPGAHPWGQRTVERASYRNNLDQIILADKMGFDTVWCVEHHFREGQSHMPCSEAVLAAISQVTSQIKLGFGVTLAPHEFIHPARIAEKVATVDLLSGGRVQWGVGRSTPMEQAAFGVDRTKSKQQMLAAIRTVTGMWEQEYYEEDSEYLKFPKRMVTPKPYQFPHPPIWMAASSEETVRMAAENGLGLLCFSILQPLEKLKGLIDIYREVQANSTPIGATKTDKVGIYTLVHCTDTREKFGQNRLWESMWWWYTQTAQFTLDWELRDMPQEDRERAFPLLQKQAAGDFDITQFDREDMVIIGTPDECIEKLLRYEAAGVDQVLAKVQFGQLPQEAVLESIRLLGTHVIPELKKRGAGRVASALQQQVDEQLSANAA